MFLSGVDAARIADCGVGAAEKRLHLQVKLLWLLHEMLIISHLTPHTSHLTPHTFLFQMPCSGQVMHHHTRRMAGAADEGGGGELGIS